VSRLFGVGFDVDRRGPPALGNRLSKDLRNVEIEPQVEEKREVCPIP